MLAVETLLEKVGTGIGLLANVVCAVAAGVTVASPIFAVAAGGVAPIVFVGVPPSVFPPRIPGLVFGTREN